MAIEVGEGNDATVEEQAAIMRSFLEGLVDAFDLDQDSPTRQKFLARLQGEIGKRGVIDVLRKGIKHGPHDVTLFYGTPTPGNVKATVTSRFYRNIACSCADPEKPFCSSLKLFPIMRSRVLVNSQGKVVRVCRSFEKQYCPISRG